MKKWQVWGNATSEYARKWFCFKCISVCQVDAKEGEVQGFFFMSKEALTGEKLMILIHGSGVVRAGQWTRK